MKAKKISINLSEETIDEINKLSRFLGLDTTSTTIRFAIRKLYNEHHEQIKERETELTRGILKRR